MNPRIVLILIAFISSGSGLAQHAHFTVDANACRNQLLELNNLSSGATDFGWDFCPRDSRILSTNTSLNPISGLSGGYGYKLVEDNGQWYAFLTSQFTSSVFRLNFGNSPTNVPTVTNLGNPQSSLSFPHGLDVVKAGSNWYAFVTNNDNGFGIVRLDFGTSLLNVPTAQNIGMFGATGRVWDVKVVKQGADFVMLFPNYNNNQIVRVNFRESFDNPTAGFVTQLPIAGSNLPAGIDAIETSSEWIVLLSSYSGNTIQQISFGSDILTTPTVQNTYSFASVNRPYRIKIIQEGLEYSVAISNESVPVKLIDFHDFNTLNPPTEINHAGLPSLVGIDMFRKNGKSYVHGVGHVNNRLNELVFELACDVSTTFSTEVNPNDIFYTTAGNQTIELTARDATGNKSVKAKTLVITSDVSPAVSFTTDGNICANAPVDFTASASGTIVSYDWEFGDASSGSGSTITHTYSGSGDYDATLTVMASNGCKNWFQDQVTMYNQPVADFLTPGVNPLCTNQSYAFENASTFDAGYVPSWQWKVDGVAVSSNEDLNYSFSSTADQDVSLTASIPGCEHEVIKTITGLVAGATANFSYVGICEDENTTFTNTSSGTVTGYQWDFGDGLGSTDVSPVYAYAAIGTYDVSLTANNAAGCANTITKQITIRTKPLVNFAASLPPFSCNGTPTQFNDLSPGPPDSNITSWSWNFGDSGSGSNTSALKNPQHTYALAGDYSVSLTVSTNYSCSSSIQLSTTISQTPVPDFSYSPACEDAPVNFSGTAPQAIQSWSWTIGSTMYNGQNPTHTFLSPGNSNAMLTVTASNNCFGSVNKTLVVQQKLAPDFSVEKNCVDQQTVFTDATVAFSDPISFRNWNFGTIGNTSGSPVVFAFPDAGNIPVTLVVTTQAGCSYPVTKSVEIHPSPQANFVGTPQANSPLTIHYTNSSTDADSYFWEFNDLNNTTSIQVSPSFTYPNFGRYQTALTATNALGCFHSISKTIDVVVPVYDVSLNGLELVESQPGIFNPGVTIFNNGNVPITNLELLIDDHGELSSEIVTEAILPNSSYRHILSYETDDATNYLCMEVAIDDISSGDNKVCASGESPFTSFPPYPNPAKGTIHIDWILEVEGMVNLILMNSMGQEVHQAQVQASEGLTPFVLDTPPMTAGAYLLKVNFGRFTKVYKVFISE